MMREVHLGAIQPGTKMIRVKIELRDTDIRRTIVIPENLTLEDFSDVVQVAIGWDGSHPWEFYQGKEVDWNCEVYEDEPKPRKLPWYHERWHQAPCEHTVAEVLPVKGKRLYYVYDFGDTWEHVIYRMSDPAADAVPACENTGGTWGVDDVGGAWGLESLVKALRKWGDKDCTDAECREGEMSGDKRFWYGWGKKTLREKFLAGPNGEEVSARLTAMFTEDEHVEDPPYVIDAVQAFKHTSTKVGRNDPCPCGSGKKYKKCCGR